MGVGRDALENLQLEGEADLEGAGGGVGKGPVVTSEAVAEPVSGRVEGQSWNKKQGDGRGWHQAGCRERRLQDAEMIAHHLG